MNVSLPLFWVTVSIALSVGAIELLHSIKCTKDDR